MKRLKYIMPAILLFAFFCFAASAADAPEITGKPEVRAEQPVGLRVKTVIDADIAADENTTEYGLIVTRKIFLTARGLTCNDFTLDCGANYTKGVSKGVVGGESVNLFLDKTDTELYFACYIHGIKEHYYADVIVVRPYAVFSDGVRYGEPFETSLYETAKTIYNDGGIFSALSPEHQSVITSILATPEFVVTFYVDGNIYERVQVEAGGFVTLPQDPETAEGMCFAGWSLTDDNDPENVIKLSETSIESHMKLYPVIVENPNSKEFMTMLGKGHLELGLIKRYPDTGLSKDTILLIKECIGYALEDANRGILVDKSYLKNHPVYGGMVEDVKANIDEKMTSTQQSNFVNFITNTRNISKDVQDFLIDYFDIDTSKYQS
ncbi:MAG: InlB B-repeat-containing protein [Clostridia bacterium]|nr:InlB B-repeat-containing protein [Clostridia bacterium]